MKHIVIIGNGISGITTARWIRKLSGFKITVISSETDYFYSRTALMYIYMGHMRAEDTKPYEDWFWKKNKINLLKAHVQNIDFNSKILTLNTAKKLSYDKLVLALGSTPNMFNWPGQNLEGVGGLYHMKDLEIMEKYSNNLERAVIVGGGLIGIEMAEMFNSRHIPVTMLVREPAYWSNVLPIEESELVSRHIMKNNIDLRLGVNLGSINDNGEGRVHSVTIKETNKKIPCGFVGLTAGVSPNINWLKETPLESERGILVNNHLQTNIPEVYAVGDCAQLKHPISGRRSIEAIWYVGRMMGETAAYNICDRPKSYNPGLWFNSAKFFDIEYQVYGEAPATIPPDMKSLYWEHNNGEISIRINYDAETGAIRGFNLLGIRYRHEVCEKWILNKTHIEKVLQNLGLANFDPEFYKEYEQNVIDLYNIQNSKKIKLKQKRGLRAALNFLNN